MSNTQEDTPIKKVDHRRRTMRLLEERFEQERITNELHYYNLKAFLEIQNDEIETLKELVSRLVARVEQLEVEAKIHPLKKMLGAKYSKEVRT